MAYIWITQWWPSGGGLDTQPHVFSELGLRHNLLWTLDASGGQNNLKNIKVSWYWKMAQFENKYSNWGSKLAFFVIDVRNDKPSAQDSGGLSSLSCFLRLVLRNHSFVCLLPRLLVIIRAEQGKTWLWLPDPFLTRMVNIMTIMKTSRVLLYLSLHGKS